MQFQIDPCPFEKDGSPSDNILPKERPRSYPSKRCFKERVLSQGGELEGGQAPVQKNVVQLIHAIETKGKDDESITHVVCGIEKKGRR